MVETIRLESGHTRKGIESSNLSLSARTFRRAGARNYRRLNQRRFSGCLLGEVPAAVVVHEMLTGGMRHVAVERQVALQVFFH